VINDCGMGSVECGSIGIHKKIRSDESALYFFIPHSQLPIPHLK
jgi:hypothetical protein